MSTTATNLASDANETDGNKNDNAHADTHADADTHDADSDLFLKFVGWVDGLRGIDPDEPEMFDHEGWKKEQRRRLQSRGNRQHGNSYSNDDRKTIELSDLAAPTQTDVNDYNDNNNNNNNNNNARP